MLDPCFGSSSGGTEPARFWYRDTSLYRNDWWKLACLFHFGQSTSCSAIREKNFLIKKGLFHEERALLWELLGEWSWLASKSNGTSKHFHLFLPPEPKAPKKFRGKYFQPVSPSTQGSFDNWAIVPWENKKPVVFFHWGSVPFVRFWSFSFDEISLISVFSRKRLAKQLEKVKKKKKAVLELANERWEFRKA